MNIGNFIDNKISQHSELLNKTASALYNVFPRIVSACHTSLRKGGKVLLFGNGGSAADAQHIATEFVVRFQKNRRALRAIALTTDTSLLTAAGNDFGFETIFSRQIEAHCDSGDVVIGISTSGNSENIIRGLKTAKKMGAVTVALTGGDGGRIREDAEHVIVVPSKETGRIQEMHILIGHMLVEAIEMELGI